jgi:ammonia channel protein AmtB
MHGTRECSLPSRKFISRCQIWVRQRTDSFSVALAVGAVAERGRLLPCVIFMFIWTTVVYDAIACWTWNPSGWLYKLGGLDFRSLITYSNYIAHLDGVTIIPGAWLNHNYRQLGIQLAGSVAGGGYSFVVSVIILTIINFIGKYLSVFRLRASLEEEDLGIDDVEIGEFAVCMTSPL